MTRLLRGGWWACAVLAVVPGLLLALVLVPAALSVTLLLLGAGAGAMWHRSTSGWPAWLGPCPLVTSLGAAALGGWLVAGGAVVLLPAIALVGAARGLGRESREGGRHPGTRWSHPRSRPRCLRRRTRSVSRT